MKRFVARLSLVLTVVAPAALGAQAAPAAPEFKVLTVYRESVKPGKGDAHEAHENAWARAVAATKSPTPFLAVTAMSGATENWYMSPYADWADLEKSNKANADNAALVAVNKQYTAPEADYLSDGRMMVLTFREDLSYGGPADLAASRYFVVTRVSIRPGHNAEYEENRRMVKAAHESVKAADKYSMWQAVAGAPAGTFFTIAALKSLAELDQSATIHGTAYLAALGDSTARMKMTANQSAAIVSAQTDIFAFAPQQSVPPPAWVTADPGYWQRKAAPKKTP